MTRLDRIEHEAREIGKYMEMGGGTDGTGIGDTLALVAVARHAAAMYKAEEAYNREGMSLHDHICAIEVYDAADEALRAALAPLLESTTPRQGNARHD